MKKLNVSLVLLVAACYGGVSLAVSMNFTGSFRGEATHYSKGNLGVPGTNPTKAFLSGRALLNPNLIVDDHFSIRSQWSLLTSPSFTPNATQGLGQGQGGYIFGDPSAANLALSRAWLEWTSDFGVLRLGRMPISWGYGLVYDAGNGVWDDFQSTLDRLEYRLHLGHVVGAIAYSKGRKLSVIGNQNDQEFYTLFLQYDNPEMEVEGGFLFEKQARSSSQQADLMGTSGTTVPANPYAVPAGTPATGLSGKTPAALSNNLLDAYIKKTMGYFTFGGEASWIVGDAADYNGNGVLDKLNAFGILLSTSYEFHKVKTFLDFMYASGDSNLMVDHLNGFVALHRNRRYGLILGRELLGNSHGNTVSQGSLVAYSDANSFSGVLVVRPGIRIDWSPNWASGAELIIARKAAAPAGADSSLGVELDLGTEYAVYKNFDLGLNLGFLFPGKGLGVANPSTVFAVRTTAALRF